MVPKFRRGAKGECLRIRSKTLTTCSVTNDGSNVDLEFLDQAGDTVTLELSVEQAEAIVMTLPHLLARAVRLQTGNSDARFVFGLHEWALEDAKDQNCLIATLKTTNGFEVSFGIPFEACQSLGLHLLQDVDKAVEAAEVREIAPARIKLN
jgi:hypothetical protein